MSRSAVWTLTLLLVALISFYFVPRRGSGLVMGEGAISQSGFNSAGLDLNSVGWLDMSTDLVMRVEVEDAAGQPVQFGPDQYWRGLTCSYYRGNRWEPYPLRASYDLYPLDFTYLPRVRRDLLLVKFTVDMTMTRRSHQGLALEGDYGRDVANPLGSILFLTEPITYIQGMPVVEIRDGRVQNLSFRAQETALYSPVTFRAGRLKYHQLSRRMTSGQRHWSSEIAWWWPPPLEIMRHPLESLLAAGWAGHPLAGSATAWALHAAGFPDGPFDRVDPRRYYKEELTRIQDDTTHEKIKGKTDALLEEAGLQNANDLQIALFLEQHLAASGEYLYSQERVRKDRRIDRTADFVLNVKYGHCEHFASALALMLRTQGIPSRVVSGYRGADWNPYSKIHEIRQYHAHAWVEALLDPNPTDGRLQFRRWLTLDPTPVDGIYAARTEGNDGWFKNEREFLVYLWEYFILDYGDEQSSLMDLEMPTLGWLPVQQIIVQLNQIREGQASEILWILLAAGVGVPVVVGAIVWNWRSRRRANRLEMKPTVYFYQRILRLLEPLSLRPRPDQTPQEFGEEAAKVLKSCGTATATVADIPTRIVTAFYRVRYGGKELDSIQEEKVKKDLDKLEAVIEAIAKGEVASAK